MRTYIIRAAKTTSSSRAIQIRTAYALVASLSMRARTVAVHHVSAATDKPRGTVDTKRRSSVILIALR